MSKLELVERETPEGIVIEIVGQLTIGSDKDRLVERVRSHLEAGRRLLVINMSKCERADSSGFGALVTCLVTAARHDANLYLARVPSQIHGLIKMAHLHSAFQIFDTEEAALRYAPGSV